MIDRPGLLEALWKERRAMSRYEAFLDLVDLAATRRETVMVAKELVTLERGQLLASSRFLHQRWRWTSRRRVVEFLEWLESQGEITLHFQGKPNAGRTTLTLTRYEHYVLGRATPGHLLGHPKSFATQALTPFRGPPSEPKEVGVNPASQVEIVEASASPGGSGGNSEADHKPDLSTSHDPLATLPDAVSRHGEGFIAFATAVTSAANASQRDNGRIDRERYRPLAPHHPKTLATLLEWWGQGVTPDFARRYVWTEGARFMPTPSRPQIASLAYLRAGLLKAWREQRVPSPLPAPPEPPRRKSAPTPISASSTLAAFLRDDVEEPES